jgi:predicted S18 family serine protease
MRYTTKQLSTRGSAVAGCLLVLFLMATPAGATTISECHDTINVVRGELAGVEIGGNHPVQTRASLDSKLDGADLKLEQGKFYDALQKLTQFRDKVLSLQSEGKITDGTSTVADLLAEANNAITCVNNLIAGS